MKEFYNVCWIVLILLLEKKAGKHLYGKDSRCLPVY